MTRKYVAMWSGPRNISTAMMRAWGNRPDTVVCDEPLYAHYLLATKHTDHPGYDEIIARHDTDWRRVVRRLTRPVPDGKRVFYQKHMAHHVLPGMSMDWIDELDNCLLIRDPHQTLLSLTEFLPSPTLEETGLPQQVKLFEYVVERRGSAPPVVDAKDVLLEPVGMLRALCGQLGVPFYEEMLSWPAGPRETDGVWAPHWYEKTYATTSFTPYRTREGQLAEHMTGVFEDARELYNQLFQLRIRPEQQQH